MKKVFFMASVIALFACSGQVNNQVEDSEVTEELAESADRKSVV